MTSPTLDAVLGAVERLPAGIVEELARAIVRAGSAELAGGVADAVPEPGYRRVADVVVRAWRTDAGLTAGEVAAMLRAAAAARDVAGREGRVDVVITGPAQPGAPTRSTEAVVVDLVAAAKQELLMVTYAAVPYEPLLAALASAGQRGVRLRVVVETVVGARGLLQTEPAAVFAGVPGIEVFHWPAERRSGHLPGRLHAKVAVADRQVAFVTSANLTGSAIESNLECGLLVHGGPVPRRLADHFAALMRAGVLARLPGQLGVGGRA